MLNSERFINSFKEIECYLQSILSRIDNTYVIGKFIDYIEETSKSNSVVRTFKNDLQKFRQLRNIIIHHDKVIAEPNNETVLKIEQILKFLKLPPQIETFLKNKKAPFCLDMSDSIERAVKIMHSEDYSQIPIYDKNSFKGLLTTNTITQWLGAPSNDDLISLRETKIYDIIKFEENERKIKPYTFMSRKENLFDLIDKFKKSYEKGVKLDAILITENGKNSEKLLGILTIWDLPIINEKLKI